MAGLFDREDLAERGRVQAFLERNAVRRHSIEEARRFWEELHDPSLVGYPSLEESHEHRIMVAWRLTRALAGALGILHPDQPLSDLNALDPSPWTVPRRPGHRPGALPSAGARAPGLRGVRELANEKPGLTLLPPKIPNRFEAHAVMRRRYNPADRDRDPDLHRWCDARAILARQLKIGETERGRWGLRGMLEPGHVRRLHPRQEEITAFEEVLLEDALELLQQMSEREVEDQFVDELGLTRAEAQSVIALVDERASNFASRSLELWKGRLLMHLDDVRKRARNALDIRTERWAIKDMANIVGVTRGTPNDLDSEIDAALGQLDQEDLAAQDPEQDFGDEDAAEVG